MNKSSILDSLMKVASLPSLSPRKTPVQARAAVTIDAIFEATIQVLLAGGLGRLTTTKVAKRAGVSVGTMYQYYPHKQSLLYAVLDRHLAMIRDAIEETCRSHRGLPIAIMSGAVVTAYLNAKTRRCDETRALYQVAAELDSGELIDSVYRRIGSATAALFATATDAEFSDLALVNSTFLNALSGSVHSLFQRDTPPDADCAYRGQLVLMCQSYLEAARVKGQSA
ncbi:TetR/AcrR family transcriptional regulator [Bradyrhizobium prioriisuperbiae]|uniref:TetR/AcrR family transcriptional regulator n=1 Tax=Bradyrhizobium prioriisuperbiae TaxID=2854389 RepID=UPI0028EA3A21|nr:TetR/AcrR family transcriptional regulator [Bradyrhizobium prioritasuperba]